MSIVVNFTAPDISLGAPVVDTSALTQNYAFNSVELSFGLPVIDLVTCVIDRPLQAVNVSAGLPNIGLGIFPFMETTPPPENYDDVTITPSIWTDTPEPAQKTFANAPAPSSPTFNNTSIDNTDIWSDT